VADGEVAAQRLQRLLVEDLADEPEILEHRDVATVADSDTGGLLATVLQCEQAEVAELGDVFAGGPDTEYAALLARSREVGLQRLALGGALFGDSVIGSVIGSVVGSVIGSVVVGRGVVDG